MARIPHTQVSLHSLQSFAVWWPFASADYYDCSVTRRSRQRLPVHPVAGPTAELPTFSLWHSAPKGRPLLYARPMSPDIVVIVRWLVSCLAIVGLPHMDGAFRLRPCDGAATR